MPPSLSKIILALVLITLIFGCQNNNKDGKSHSDAVLELGKQVSDQLVDQGSKLGGDIKKLSSDELNKALKIEYKVVEFSSTLNTKEIQAIMEPLGNDRWDCFHTLHSEQTVRLLCKKQPLSVVRALISSRGMF